MVMFQATAMLQDVAPAAPAAPRGAGVRGASEKAGGFKQVLQDRQQQDGANEPPKGEASKAEQGTRTAERGRDAAVTGKEHGRAARRPLNHVAARPSTTETSSEGAGAAVKGNDAPSRGEVDAKGSEEAEATVADAAGEEKTAPAAVETKVVLPVPGMLNGNLKAEEKTISVAEQGVAAVQAAGERAARNADELSREEAGGKEIPAAKASMLPPGAAGNGMAATDMAFGQELSKVASLQGVQKQGVRPSTQDQAAPQDQATQERAASQPATQEKRADDAAGKVIPFTRMRGGIFYERPLASARSAAQDDTAAAGEVKPAETAERQPQQASTPVMGEETPAAVAQQDPAQQLVRQGAAAAAPEGAQKEAKVSTTKAEAQQVDLQTAEKEQDGARSNSVEKKDARPVEVHGRHGFEKVMADESGVTQKPAVEEASGTKTTSASDAPKLAATPQQPGQDGSGDAAGKGHQEQNAHIREVRDLPAAAANQPQAVDTTSAESKQAGPRTPLHESILSQVKEGVVTHDGKGNGQVSIRLNPGELGELKIQVRMDDNRLRIEVQADNRMVKDLLLGNLDSLKEALTGKNLAMDGFNVSTGGSSGFNSALGEHREGAQQQSMPRSARSGYGESGQSEGRVKYLTAEVNNLLDVRF